jgi:hypothetical protein
VAVLELPGAKKTGVLLILGQEGFCELTVLQSAVLLLVVASEEKFAVIDDKVQVKCQEDPIELFHSQYTAAFQVEHPEGVHKVEVITGSQSYLLLFQDLLDRNDLQD